MGQHALLAPSGFQALLLCPAKPAMERGLPDESSEYADEGTAAHFLGSWCLERGEDAARYTGRRILVTEDGAEWAGDSNGGKPGGLFAVTEEMAEAVQVYIDTVRARVSMYQSLGGVVELFVEQAVPIGHITGEEGAEGTADVVIIAAFPDGRVLVENIDLKYGKGVEVEAEDNPQLKLYCLGAAEKYGMVFDFTHASMLICQPRVSTVPSEWSCTFPELVQWGLDVAGPAAQQAMGLYHGGAFEPMLHCKPHEDACRFCKAKPTCPALAGKVQEALGREFTDLTTADQPEREAIVATCVATADAGGDLGARMDAVPLVEMWAKAIRGRVEKHLLEGKPVAGYKLVPGRKGARAWCDAAEAEKTLKSMRFKKEQMYEFSVISPTTAEKLLKTTPKRWAKVQPLITQNDAKPSVAPLSDKRAALEVKPIEAEFTPITETPATADDLV